MSFDVYPDYLTDAELILRGLLEGVLHWQPSQTSPEAGTLRFKEVGYWINRDERGLPKIHPGLRRMIIEEIAPVS